MIKGRRVKVAQENEEKITKAKPPKAVYPSFVSAPLIYQQIDNPYNAKESDELIKQMLRAVEQGAAAGHSGINVKTENILCLIAYSGSAFSLSRCIYKLPPATRACLNSIWLNKKWNCINKRCGQCLKPNTLGDCTLCVIPILHDLSADEWLKRKCKVCHKNKPFNNALLCGSGECMLKFIMVTKPVAIPLVGWLRNKRCVVGTIAIQWTNYDLLQRSFASRSNSSEFEVYYSV